jgi:primosomal protein N'
MRNDKMTVQEESASNKERQRLVLDAQRLEQRLHKAGLIATAQKMNEVVRAIGWEMANDMERARRPAPTGPRKRTVVPKGTKLSPVQKAALAQIQKGERIPDERFDAKNWMLEVKTNTLKSLLWFELITSRASGQGYKLTQRGRMSLKLGRIVPKSSVREPKQEAQQEQEK